MIPTAKPIAEFHFQAISHTGHIKMVLQEINPQHHNPKVTTYPKQISLGQDEEPAH
jgi:hypothetical protein